MNGVERYGVVAFGFIVGIAVGLWLITLPAAVAAWLFLAVAFGLALSLYVLYAGRKP